MSLRYLIASPSQLRTIVSNLNLLLLVLFHVTYSFFYMIFAKTGPTYWEWSSGTDLNPAFLARTSIDDLTLPLNYSDTVLVAYTLRKTENIVVTSFSNYRLLSLSTRVIAISHTVVSPSSFSIRSCSYVEINFIIYWRWPSMSSLVSSMLEISFSKIIIFFWEFFISSSVKIFIIKGK